MLKKLYCCFLFENTYKVFFTIQVYHKFYLLSIYLSKFLYFSELINKNGYNFIIERL